MVKRIAHNEEYPGGEQIRTWDQLLAEWQRLVEQAKTQPPGYDEHSLEQLVMAVRNNMLADAPPDDYLAVPALREYGHRTCLLAMLVLPGERSSVRDCYGRPEVRCDAMLLSHGPTTSYDGGTTGPVPLMRLLAQLLNEHRMHFPQPAPIRYQCP